MSETTSLPYMNASLLTVTKSTASGMMTVAFGAGGNLTAFSPNQLAGLVGWWDASQIAGVSSGASLSAWTDLSASANNMSQSSEVNKPLYIASGQNSLGIVRFLYAGNSSDTGSYMNISDPLNTFVSGTTYSVLWTGAPREIAAQAFVLAKDSSDSGRAYSFGQDTNIAEPYLQIAGTAILGGPLGSFNSWHVHALVGIAGSSSTHSIYLDFSYSSVKVSSSVGTTCTTETLVGRRKFATSRNYYGGDLGELLVYNAALTSSQISQCQNYLRNKWGTP